jgi:hypothetical protein
MKSVITVKRTINEANLREEALQMLDKRGAFLDVAREVSQLMREAGIPGVIIGGVAVVLHGHVRTTKDVDVALAPPLEPLAELLTANGFTFDKKKKEFRKYGVPVHLVLPEQFGEISNELVEIEGISTVSLAQLISMKLRSGSENMLRAQDLADVIGLIRHHRLSSEFARHLDKNLRPVFRKFVRMIKKESSGK